MEYNFRDIEKKWQVKWIEDEVYQVPNISEKPKFYVLDMFPYPSGAGLHVGHPLGYIASDIFARYKRLRGFNVLHPMGYDAFGLPAEQYALEHGVHPAESTEKNIATFRRQLDNIGFSFDWSREIRTSSPAYYKWTQWIFLQLFNSWYNRNTNKTEPLDVLTKIFEAEGNSGHPVPAAGFRIPGQTTHLFSAAEWQAFPDTTQAAILMEYRIAYCGYGEVNWCEALGTVLANDEVVNGVSERGGFPVEKKRLRQWYLRITEYADRLLNGLQTVDFSEAMKEMQSNWIGKSIGAEIWFAVPLEEGKSGEREARIACYTTRPDTLFGVDFLVLAPEHELVAQITTPSEGEAVTAYVAYVKSRSERERMAEKKITGVFTGAYALHPFSQKPIPVWISEYVLAGYGTGAIMAVPSGDERDHKFALYFNLPITNIVGAAYTGKGAYLAKDLVLENSDFLTGMNYDGATEVVLKKLEEAGAGRRKVNYKMRDAAFSRQRYWGEPFPIVWRNGVAIPLDESELPLQLPHVDNYKPGPEGEGPLANIEDWADVSGGEARGTSRRETNTMPGYAGSSWYFLRYMDPHNNNTFCEKNISTYWNQVDLYVGGTEHAVGHLLYSRMWTKCLYDLGHISFDEPFKRLLNQGMIQGSSRFVYRVSEDTTPEIPGKDAFNGVNQLFVSHGIAQALQMLEDNGERLSLLQQYAGDSKIIRSFEAGIKLSKFHVDVNIVDGAELDTGAFRSSKPEFAHAIFLLEDGSLDAPGSTSPASYICGTEVEKMSKSKYNTVNPDVLVEKYGADTFRMYEMFLGPVEMSKPWDTKGIEGVHRFLKKLWKLFYGEDRLLVTDELPTAAELKVLHKTIKKIEEDTERFSFNTCISAFMVCVNDLTELRCHKKKILSDLLILLVPYAPHVACELWERMHALLPGGEAPVLLDAAFPQLQQQYLVETVKEYPVSVNGKLRTTIPIDLALGSGDVESIVLENGVVQKWLEGKAPKKIIFVAGKMINIVV